MSQRLARFWHHRGFRKHALESNGGPEKNHSVGGLESIRNTRRKPASEQGTPTNSLPAFRREKISQTTTLRSATNSRSPSAASRAPLRCGVHDRWVILPAPTEEAATRQRRNFRSRNSYAHEGC